MALAVLVQVKNLKLKVVRPKGPQECVLEEILR